MTARRAVLDSVIADAFDGHHILSLREVFNPVAISPAAAGNTFLCRGKGLFSESVPIPPRPRYPENSSKPPAPYSLRGESLRFDFVIADAFDGLF